jgi:mannosyltransferase OCH1-like enzyme
MSKNLIPRNIFFSLANKEILKDKDNKYTQIINKIKKNYSNFEIFIYDDNESYKVIDEYGDNILKICYQEILPGSYKCDILRLILLEKYGGIYIDLGLYPDPKYLLPIINNNDLVLCQDRAQCGSGYKIYNAIMGSIKNHIFIKNVIAIIKIKIANFRYGRGTLDISGPSVVGQVFSNIYHIQPAIRNKDYENT